MTKRKPFKQVMIEELLLLPLSKRAISRITGLSMNTINRILSSKHVNLKLTTYNQVFRLYVTEVLIPQQQKYTDV